MAGTKVEVTGEMADKAATIQSRLIRGAANQRRTVAKSDPRSLVALSQALSRKADELGLVENTKAFTKNNALLAQWDRGGTTIQLYRNGTLVMAGPSFDHVWTETEIKASVTEADYAMADAVLAYKPAES